MRALFGIISLLVVLAIVGMVAVRQSRSVSTPLVATGALAGAASGAASEATKDAVGVGTPPQQAQGIERRVQDDVAKALDQAAAARKQADDQ